MACKHIGKTNLMVARGQTKQCKLKQWKPFSGFFFWPVNDQEVGWCSIKSLESGFRQSWTWDPASLSTSCQLLQHSELHISDSNYLHQPYPPKGGAGHTLTTLNLSCRFPLSLRSGNVYFNLNLKFWVFNDTFLQSGLYFLQKFKLFGFTALVVFCRNEAVVISGRKLAQQIKQEVRQEVEEWVASGNKRPHLSVVLIGENPASHSYVLNKTRAAADVGMCHPQIPTAVALRLRRGKPHCNSLFLFLIRKPKQRRLVGLDCM